MNLSLRRRILPTLARVLAPAFAVLLLGLAGCNSVVGSGNAPRRIVIVSPSATTPLVTLAMYQCLTSAVRALLYFDDGSVGDFTRRATWSSSNTGAVEVSNDDVVIPGTGGFYAAGTLIPRGPGKSVVTANYFGIATQMVVSVGTPQNIHLTYLDDGLYRPLYQVNLDQTSPRDFFTMGSGSTVQLAVLATLDGIETDISAFADFHFREPNDGVATITASGNGAGVISALSQGGPLVPVASFSPCGLDNISDPNGIVSMSVQPITQINMRAELSNNPNQAVSASNPLVPLIAGNAEKFIVEADLANGDKQDVHSQSTLTTSNSSFAIFGASGSNNILTSTAPGGPLVISADFKGINFELQSGSYSTSVQQRQLSTISVCWSDALDYTYNIYDDKTCLDPTDPAYVAPASNPSVGGGSLQPLQFHAMGNYGTNDAGTGYLYQDVTRTSVWSSSNAGAATIRTNPLNAGQASAASLGPSSTTITTTTKG